jgi:hypothetical protein
MTSIFVRALVDSSEQCQMFVATSLVATSKFLHGSVAPYVAMRGEDQGTKKCHFDGYALLHCDTGESLLQVLQHSRTIQFANGLDLKWNPSAINFFIKLNAECTYYHKKLLTRLVVDVSEWTADEITNILGQCSSVLQHLDIFVYNPQQDETSSTSSLPSQFSGLFDKTKCAFSNTLISFVFMVQGQPIDNSELSSIGQAFPKLETLVLDFSRTKVDNDSALSDCLSHLTRLREVSFLVSETSGEFLLALQHSARTLYKLNLSGNHKRQYIVQMLELLPNLRHFSLFNTLHHIDGEPHKNDVLLGIANQSNCRLQTLSLNHCFALTEAGFSAICDCVDLQDSLRELSLVYIRVELTNDMFKKICMSFSNIEKFCFSVPYLTDECWIHLGELKNLKYLRIEDFNDWQSNCGEGFEKLMIVDEKTGKRVSRLQHVEFASIDAYDFTRKGLLCALEVLAPSLLTFEFPSCKHQNEVDSLLSEEEREQLDKETGEQIVSILRPFNKIITLRSDRCELLSNETLKPIVEGLPSLQRLDVSSVRIKTVKPLRDFKQKIGGDYLFIEHHSDADDNDD